VEHRRVLGYNARLSPDEVDRLPDADYPVVVALPHAHKDGVSCEEHCRCGVVLGGTLVTVDVPAWFVGTLPRRSSCSTGNRSRGR
jgi:hypothetical protein